MDDPVRFPQLIEGRCNLCGACVQVCSNGVWVMHDAAVQVNTAEECDGCGTCEVACTQDAIDCPFEIVWGDAEQDPAGADAEGGKTRA